MSSNTLDYSVFDRFNFERKPVGVKFLPIRPEGIERAKKKVALCEMFNEALSSGPFYVQKEDFICVETQVGRLGSIKNCAPTGESTSSSQR